MLKAGSIIYALAVALVVALTSLSLIMVDHLSRIETQSYERIAALTDNASAGILLLQMSSEQTVNSELDLYDNGTDSVRLQKRAWGMFDVGISIAHHGRHIYGKSALLGQSSDPKTRTALYVTDQGRPIKVCGATELRGRCFLPESGVERSYIEGQNYVGDRLVYGPVEPSNKSLPKVDEQRLLVLQNYLRGKAQTQDSVVAWESLTTDSIAHPFSKRTLVIVATGSLSLDHGTYQGNVIFISNRAISIASSVNLDQVLLFAPEILIQQNTAARIQAFASHHINVEQNVALSYPSVLGSLDEHRIALDASIELAENAKVSGLVFAIAQKTNARFPVFVKLAKNSRIEGTVYVAGSTELQGTVVGSLYTNRFTLKTPSSQYSNQLLNATVTTEDFSPDFAEPYLFAKPTNNAIVQWLY